MTYTYDHLILNSRELKMLKTKNEAIQHYDKMIKWAEKQNKYKIPSVSKMYYEIKTTWAGQHCSYCNIHNTTCFLCELHSKNSCCDGLWLRMDRSKTWKEWIKYAKKIKRFIEKNG